MVRSRECPCGSSLPTSLDQCDNRCMHKSFTSMVHILAAGIVLLGSNSQGQQTPAAKPPAAPATKTRRAAPAAKSPAPLALTTQKDKFSYALGMNLGGSLKKQSVAVDPNILARGLKDALAGGKTALTEDQARATRLYAITGARCSTEPNSTAPTSEANRQPFR